MSNEKPKRTYDAEFKRNTAELYLNSDKSLSAISIDLGIPESTIHHWVQEYKVRGSSSFMPKELSVQEKELLDLKKQLADVKIERDILKKALAIFSKKK